MNTETEAVSIEQKEVITLRPPMVSILGTKCTLIDMSICFASIKEKYNTHYDEVVDFILNDLKTTKVIIPPNFKIRGYDGEEYDYDVEFSFGVKGRFQQKMIENTIRSYIRTLR